MATTTQPPRPSEPEFSGDDTSGVLEQGGIVAAVQVATAVRPLLNSSAAADETHSAGERDPRTIFYHGTDPASALSLLNGTPLLLQAALANRANPASVPGFYLATDPDVAMYFASLHNKGVTLLRYAMTTVALRTLLATGATLGPVPRGAAIASFSGSQLWVAPTQFGRFNGLLRDGSIGVQPCPLGG
jgi:hypothetical protein